MRRHIVQHQVGDAIGICGGVHRAKAEVAASEQRRAVEPHGVEDSREVVHLLLERRRARDRIEQAGAAAIVPQHSSERCKSFERAYGLGLLPRDLEVGGRAGDDDQVDVPFPRDLVGDAHVAAARSHFDGALGVPHGYVPAAGCGAQRPAHAGYLERPAAGGDASVRPSVLYVDVAAAGGNA